MNLAKITLACEKVVYAIFFLMDMSSAGIDALWHVMCINMIVFDGGMLLILKQVYVICVLL